jgi:hypothetical protein
MSTATNTRHPLTISYTLIVTDEVIDYIKSSDGCRYWVADDEYEVHTDIEGETYLINNGYRYNFDTESCLRGIALWIQNGGDWDDLKECGTDHTDHDAIWQYAFFNELVYG